MKFVLSLPFLCIKKNPSTNTILILVLLIWFTNGRAQFITTSEAMTETQLVENVLFNTSCATVSNVTVSGGNFTSGEKSWGYFNANGSSFPFQDGIILSTGRIANAVGPNSYISDDGASIGWGTDPDLNQALSISNTMNATILEFDFVPYGNKISFDYIFASEEYHGTATCNYSDGFAFLLKPVGSSVYENLAIIPGTTTPVKVTTVHPAIPGGCPAQNEQYFGSFNSGNYPTNFNGETAVLTAQANVIPGTAYHIKLVIADEVNFRYDSAIFLKGSSFNFGIDLGPDRLVATQNPVCPNETITLNASTTATAYQWNFNGTPIVGATNSTFTLTPPYTNFQNGNYSVDITYNPTCTINSEITLEFAPELTINQQVFDFCDADEDGLTSINLASIAPLLYTNLPTNYAISFYDSLTSSTPLPSNYTNTQAFSQTIYAKINNSNCYSPIPITLNMLIFGATITNPSFGVCNGNTIQLNADAGYSSYLWNTGATVANISVNTAGTYSVAITNASGCTRTQTFTVITSEMATIESININGLDENNSAEIMVSGNGNYQFSLDGINYQDSNVFYNLSMGDYFVYVYDVNQCGIAGKSFTMVGIPKFFTPNDDGINDFWNIQGLKPEINSKSTIAIYDRYGKLIKEISAIGKGWNGKINNLLMPSDDYWFVLNLENGNTAKGHFALKR